MQAVRFESVRTAGGKSVNVEAVKGASLKGLGALAGGTGVAVQAICLLER
ncbi:MAG: hypothetical protein HZA52_02235 [Planctomycetes bacterium]|nr:hypothetical protein [Planctomycetota bacterium]